MTNRDTIEMKLVSQIFDFAKSVADMRLSDEALALYSAYILLQEGMYNHLKYLVQFVIFRNPYLMNMDFSKILYSSPKNLQSLSDYGYILVG